MAGFNPNEFINVGLYVPSTNVWEVSQLQDLDINSEEFKLLLVRLYQNINAISIALNLKDSAYYVLQEFVNGQQFFSTDPANPLAFRSDFRLVLNIGALPPGITVTAHNLAVTTAWTFTRIYGVGSDTVNLLYYPIPWAGAAAAYISIIVDGTNVTIDNQSGVTFTQCIVVLEYLKN